MIQENTLIHSKTFFQSLSRRNKMLLGRQLKVFEIETNLFVPFKNYFHYRFDTVLSVKIQQYFLQMHVIPLRPSLRDPA